jgi:hypothetical protein
MFRKLQVMLVVTLLMEATSLIENSVDGNVYNYNKNL